MHVPELWMGRSGSEMQIRQKYLRYPPLAILIVLLALHFLAFRVHMPSFTLPKKTDLSPTTTTQSWQ